MASQPETILIVDPKEANRSVLAQQVTQLGYQFVVAEQGRQALGLLETQQFQVVLLSISLWGLNSYQVLERMNDSGILRSTPVIMLAAADNSPEIERAFALGATDYLVEPFNLPMVKARLAACAAHKRLRAAEHDLAQREELLKIERDVQIARQIQLGFLPTNLPQLPGWEIAARFYPAREVAGDFYDAFMLTQKRRVGFVIADVADKGVGAALFMSLARSLVRAFAQQHYTAGWMDMFSDTSSYAEPRRFKPAAPSIGTTALKNAMVLTNNYITDNHIDMNMFVTLFFGVLDPSTGALIYVNGGHVPPLIVGPEGVKATLGMSGPAIGLFPGADFEIKQAHLDPGDILFCYTDGVTDARDPSGAFFTQKRVLQMLAQPPSSAAALLGAVEASVHAHIATAAQFDDITMLAVQRTPPES